MRRRLLRDFVFHERLEEVTERIRDQNRAVDESGDPYVTIAYMAELEIADPDDPSLSGVQGELLGLAFQQDQHNELVGRDGTPKIKLLLGNAGEAWAHAEETAREIAARAEDSYLGMDRPIGAVGFGHSVAPNSEAIRIVGDAGIPMVGTTATYDDVARSGERRHNEFFFPVAPANSRVAEQAAHWAYNGVPWTGDRGPSTGWSPPARPWPSRAWGRWRRRGCTSSTARTWPSCSWRPSRGRAAPSGRASGGSGRRSTPTAPSCTGAATWRRTPPSGTTSTGCARRTRPTCSTSPGAPRTSRPSTTTSGRRAARRAWEGT
ncbi:hypothetical protein HFP72_13325 [Nocardiopsis sp. ARC36]